MTDIMTLPLKFAKTVKWCVFSESAFEIYLEHAKEFEFCVKRYFHQVRGSRNTYRVLNTLQVKFTHY